MQWARTAVVAAGRSIITAACLEICRKCMPPSCFAKSATSSSPSKHNKTARKSNAADYALPCNPLQKVAMFSLHEILSVQVVEFVESCSASVRSLAKL